MSHVPHDLHEEFPEDGATLHRLKTGNAHFTNLADAYHDINREIHRIEIGVEAASDSRIEQLKKQRLSLLDQFSAMIAQFKAGAA